MEFFLRRDSFSPEEFRVSLLQWQGAWAKPWAIFLLLFSLTAFFLHPARCLADPISMYGLQFPVDEISIIDDSSAKVTLGLDTQIVRRVNLSNYIIQKTLQNLSRARGFSSASLEKFVEGALGEKDSKRAAWGIQGLLAHLGDDGEGVSNYLEALADRAEAGEAIKTVLSEPEQISIPNDLWARLAVGISPRTLEWFHEKYPQISPQLQGLVREDLRQRCLVALRNRELTKLDGFLAVQRTVIGDQDPGFRDMAILISRLREALDRAGKGEIDPLFSLSDVTKGNKEARELVTPFVLNEVHAQVAENLQQGQTTKALLILSRMDFDSRTPQTHELTRRALEQVTQSAETPLANSLVDQYLRRIADVDPSIKQAYIVALDKQIRLLFDSNRVDVAGDYVGRLARIRPDPSPENDSIRVLQALAFLNRGMRGSANQTVSEIQTGISSVGYGKLVWAGYYGDPLNYILILLVPSILALFVWLRRRAPILLGSNEPPPVPEEEDDDTDRPSGFAITGSRLMSPSMQEYNRCLQALGLKPGASLRQVKSSYRNLIKKVHPDLNTNLSAAEKERFVTLTKMYDRLIELRRELKFPET